MADRKPRPVFCAMPTHASAEEATVYGRLREMHCADVRPAHRCLGRIVIDRDGITLSCPRCGDARSLFPATGDG